MLRPRDRAWHPPALTPDYRTSRVRAPAAGLVRLDPTVAELTGPVFGDLRLGPLDHDLLANHARGSAPIGPRILIHGRVIDEDERPVPGALIEIWQANAAGRYRHARDDYLAPLDPNFSGCGRALSDADGSYWFRTIQPGPYPWPNADNAWRPAHVHFSIFGPAFAQRLVTQMYFEGDPLIPLCPIVNSVPSAEAVDRLVARLDLGRSSSFDMLAWRFDIVLRGRRATPFENRPEG